MTTVINSKMFAVFRLPDRGKEEKRKYKFPRRAVKIRKDEISSGNEIKFSSKVYVEWLGGIW